MIETAEYEWTEEPLLTPCEEGLRDLNVMMAVYLAARTGKTVKL